MLPILSLTLEELGVELKKWGATAFRAKQIYHWLYREGVKTFDEMTNLPKTLREKLEQSFSITAPEVHFQESKDGTKKYELTFSDGKSVEAVWIPEARRNTLCVSSQVGCPLKCAFCVTGAMGVERNLKPEEIVAQVRQIKAVEKLPLSNIVFMGMGEPLLNVDAVKRAIRILMEPQGLQIGKRRITVSTAGIVPEIAPFFEEMDVKLAISLTGANDESRDFWMPINRKYDLATLKQALKKLRWAQGRQVMFEVVVMKGVNDSLEEAKKLAEFLSGIPSKVNLIPYNENSVFPDLKRPAMVDLHKFRDLLIKRGIQVMIRKNRGNDIMAACGQLVTAENVKEKRRQFHG